MWIDLGFFIFLMYGFYLGYSQGILKTVYTILSIFIAIILSMKLSPFLINIIEDVLKLGPTISLILGFLLCFFIIMFAVRLLGRVVEKLFKVVRLNFINKSIGGVMMSLLFVVIYSVIIWFLNEAKTINQNTKDQSITYTYLEPIPASARNSIQSLKPAFKGFWEKSMEAFDESNQKPEPFNYESPSE